MRPFCKRLSWIAPAEAFRRLWAQRDIAWLDSSREDAQGGRFSILACDPRWVFEARSDAWQLCRAEGAVEKGSAALRKLDELLGQSRVTAPAAPALPFFGGAIGWLSYDLGRHFEAIAAVAKDDVGAPEIRLAWYDAALVWDHAAHEVWAVGIEGEGAQPGAADALCGLLEKGAVTIVPAETAAGVAALSDLTREAYAERVEETRRAIARGEVYQLNLVQRFRCAHGEDPRATYLRLRAVNPAPYSAYLDGGRHVVLCSSPERFLQVGSDRQVSTAPIKGTRARAADASADALRQAELLASEKERAELLMIVDLLRNDLGRVCEAGSIHVERLHALETFATVHHLVGEVRGRLRAGVSRAELLRAVFPGGSITGAPKVSAMRAIERLEPHRRGIAMGSIGYFSAHGTIDLNIAIRTIVLHGGFAYVAVGAGIVWDSDPAAEYDETLAKARALFEALRVTEYS